MIEDELLTRFQLLLHLPSESRNDAESILDVCEELHTAPLVWWNVKKSLDEKGIEKDPKATDKTVSNLPQYGVLGNVQSNLVTLHEPVLLNTNSPWSAFLCGSQGSGKSHTLSCMLENCLLKDDALGKNPNPLAGLVLHYDGSRGSGVCEAAYLCSSVKTTVLVSASNYGNLKQRYEQMAKQNGATIEVRELLISPKHLDTERVKSLMAVAKDGEAPLYIQVSEQPYLLTRNPLTLAQTLVKIIRDIAIASGGMGTFDYAKFKSELDAQMFSDKQNQPLALRLSLLESFLDLEPQKTRRTMTNWSPSPDYLVGAPGELVIVDLTDPVVDVDSACVLFDTCLSVFLAQTDCAKIIALDEAHNYLLSDNAAAKQFTGKLLKSIREQRHQGTRIVITTQEPTLDTSLLDLCSITMVHRCSSPAWFQVLKKHIAGLYLDGGEDAAGGESGSVKANERALFRQIVELKLGESLLFCPTAVVGIEGGHLQRMVDGFVKFRTRKRVTADGGRTHLADGVGGSGL
jgi:hypothetical protein